MKDAKALDAEFQDLRSIVVALSEATHRALALIEIAHRRDLAQDLGYQDLISEANHYANRARNMLGEIAGDAATTEGSKRPSETLEPNKYL